VFRLVSLEILKHGNDLVWGGVLGAEAIAAADDGRSIVLASVGCGNVQEQRFAIGAGFFSAIEDSGFS